MDGTAAAGTAGGGNRETRRGNGCESGILFRTDDQLPVTGRQTNKQIEAGNGRGKNCEWQR